MSVSPFHVFKLECWHTHGRMVHREAADRAMSQEEMGLRQRRQAGEEGLSSLKEGQLWRDTGGLKRQELGGEGRGEQGVTFPLTI